MTFLNDLSHFGGRAFTPENFVATEAVDAVLAVIDDLSDDWLDRNEMRKRYHLMSAAEVVE